MGSCYTLKNGQLGKEIRETPNYVALGIFKKAVSHMQVRIVRDVTKCEKNSFSRHHK